MKCPIRATKTFSTHNIYKASEDTNKENRGILNRAATNCANIDILTDESNKMNDETVDVSIQSQFVKSHKMHFNHFPS